MRFATLALLALPALAANPPGLGPEVDRAYHPTVDRPAYDAEQHPQVLVDEGHHETYTLAGRLHPFSELLTRDGYRVQPYRGPLTPDGLGTASVLVIVDALGAGKPFQPAFTPAECDAVHAWVEKGGALLLIADPAPAGEAAASLGRRFGVAMSQGETFDPDHSGAGGTPTAWTTFSRANHLLGEHPILAGREASERIATVVTFHGQSLKGPEGSATLLRLGDAARDLHADEGVDLSAAGRTQAIAFELGKGRVVVLADAAMVGAELVAGTLKVGMNRPGNDDRQLTLNLLHWLTRLL
jgi:hypothetical protein